MARLQPAATLRRIRKNARFVPTNFLQITFFWLTKTSAVEMPLVAEGARWDDA